MVLAVADDPIGKSSTLAYQSEQSLVSAGIPIFYPANVHEVIPMGLQAFQLSRFSGLCVALKSQQILQIQMLWWTFSSLRPKNIGPHTKRKCSHSYTTRTCFRP